MRHVHEPPMFEKRANILGFLSFYGLPGANTVGGPIELAAITKHEGFKWVTRKHYFDEQLN